MTEDQSKEDYGEGQVAAMCGIVNAILDGKDNGSGVASEPWESVRRRLLSLVATLHRNRCHPDFIYMVVPKDSIVKFSNLPDGLYEPNPEYQCMPGDECWRRRKETT